MTEAIQDVQKHGGDREFLKAVAGTVYLGKSYSLHMTFYSQLALAGSDTTTAGLGWFFLAMVIYQDVQRKVQEELDRVLQGALPRHEDLDSLPYLQAVVQEVIRYVSYSWILP